MRAIRKKKNSDTDQGSRNKEAFNFQSCQYTEIDYKLRKEFMAEIQYLCQYLKINVGHKYHKLTLHCHENLQYIFLNFLNIMILCYF